MYTVSYENKQCKTKVTIGTVFQKTPSRVIIFYKNSCWKQGPIFSLSRHAQLNIKASMAKMGEHVKVMSQVSRQIKLSWRSVLSIYPLFDTDIHLSSGWSSNYLLTPSSCSVNCWWSKSVKQLSSQRIRGQTWWTHQYSGFWWPMVFDNIEYINSKENCTFSFPVTMVRFIVISRQGYSWHSVNNVLAYSYTKHFCFSCW